VGGVGGGGQRSGVKFSRERNLTEQTAVSNGYEFTRKSLMIAEERDAFDELQSVNDVSEDAREEGHVAQQDAKLRADQSLAVVFFLRTSHSNSSTDAGQLRVFGHEEGLVGVNGTATAARIAFEITGDARLASPALKHLATLVRQYLIIY